VTDTKHVGQSGATQRRSDRESWEPYPDVWDVCTNGRHVESERDALEEAKEIFELRGVKHRILTD
jgi:hypothetical protein